MNKKENFRHACNNFQQKDEKYSNIYKYEKKGSKILNDIYIDQVPVVHI